MKEERLHAGLVADRPRRQGGRYKSEEAQERPEIAFGRVSDEQGLGI
jgi:hypothetical protein